jgi:hypothetical protein
MPLNLFHDRLEGETYEDVFTVLAAINEETSRLEFKRELDFGDVTKEVVAFANGEGGIVVVGFCDPAVGKPLKPFSSGPATADPDRLRVASKVQAKIYPSVALEVFGYKRADGAHGMLVIRVPASIQAPHEWLDQRGRFPVRRGAQIDYLTLREIEYLLARRDSHGTMGLDLGRSTPWMNFDRSSQRLFVGARVSPERPSSVRVLTKSIQKPIEAAIRSLPGLEKTSVLTLMNSILFMQDPDTRPSDAAQMMDWEIEHRFCSVSVDGMVEVRFPQDKSRLAYQLYRALCDSYAAANSALLSLGGGPRISGTFAYKLNKTPDLGPFPIGEDGELHFDADLSRDKPSDVFPELLVYAMRQAGELGDYDEFTGALEHLWLSKYLQPRGLNDMRDLW